MKNKRQLLRVFGLIWLLVTISETKLPGQAPFLRKEQVMVVFQNNARLDLFSVQAGYNSTTTDFVCNTPAGSLDAIGFRKTDNLLYGVLLANNHLIRLGQDGVWEDLGPCGLPTALFFLAGDVTPDGKFWVGIGSDAQGFDKLLIKLDLETLQPVQQINLPGATRLSDLTVEPSTGTLWGFDRAGAGIVRINPASGAMAAFPPAIPGNTFYGMYFDPFGELYAVGNTLYGVVDAFFKIDPLSGKEKRLTTGPSTSIQDVAACPYSIALKTKVGPESALPCSEITYQYRMVNGSDEPISGFEFQHPLPSGFHLAGITQNSFGVAVDTQSIPGSIRLQGLQLNPGQQRNLSVKVYVDDLPKKRYNSQPVLNGLPALYGTRLLSDDEAQAGFLDSTAFIVNRYDEDSLFFRWFVCHGEFLELDASDFGDMVQWNGGPMAATLKVHQGGIYSFKVGTTCEEVFVAHDVTSGSCPYTIAVQHSFLPDTTFACSDVVFRYVLKNDSGEPRSGLNLRNILPPGFSIKEVLQLPKEGFCQNQEGDDTLVVTGIRLPIGNDTVEVLVNTGDVSPGVYHNRAILFGLPLVMGPFRMSDDPMTSAFDSSTLVIQGALSDSVWIDTLICANAPLELDASSFGKTILWEDGSSASSFLADKPGIYQATIFDGCKPAVLLWNLEPAPYLEILPMDTFYVHQGDWLELKPVWVNDGMHSEVTWLDPLEHSLSCILCDAVLAQPLESVVYQFFVTSEFCRDSIFITVNVDQSRRVYFPNVFSPNDDGLNDLFELYTPDFLQIEQAQIFDRWGGLLSESAGSSFEIWDGFSGGRLVPPGVYTWVCRVRFIDDTRKVYSGTVTVVR